jgi:hypothetical protein
MLFAFRFGDRKPICGFIAIAAAAASISRFAERRADKPSQKGRFPFQ